jgi:hypothetical protein
MNRRELFTRHRPRLGLRACFPGVRREPVHERRLRTHDNREVRFYDDMIKGKQAIINMMYADCDNVCPAITSPRPVRGALEGADGSRPVHVLDHAQPEADHPAALKAFATMHGALRPGWTFLTGDHTISTHDSFQAVSMNHIKSIPTSTRTPDAAHRQRCDQLLDVPPLASMATVLQHISWADPPVARGAPEENRNCSSRSTKKSRGTCRKVVTPP